MNIFKEYSKVMSTWKGGVHDMDSVYKSVEKEKNVLGRKLCVLYTAWPVNIHKD